jgi:hypothetical protein
VVRGSAVADTRHDAPLETCGIPIVLALAILIALVGRL